MIRKALFRSIIGLLLFLFVIIPPFDLFPKIAFGFFACIQFISLLAFGFSGMHFEPNGTIYFRRRFKKIRYHVSQIKGIDFSELKEWEKYGFHKGGNISPGFTFPIMKFYMINSYGQYINYKIFVNTFKEDGVALKAFLESLQEVNPTLIVPDVQAFNATLK